MIVGLELEVPREKELKPLQRAVPMLQLCAHTDVPFVHRFHVYELRMQTGKLWLAQTAFDPHYWF